MIFISFNLLKFFSLLAMISSFMIIISRNPIFSVLYLILSFFNISATIFLLELEFLPIVFLVVYVGAVAVLFLFVLMMLNIKIAELKETTYHYLPIAIIFFFIFDSQFR
jgi:NADH:ubiquinone oxidoreductase subunit 6 (subunit J)